ncbi:MAG TPA: phosphoadenylyl-sulfate reductase [Rhodospirillales bacterium]|nr:phosphoadenylyl-sulfate reductase [Rhodospirillales bacterium]
MTPPDQMRPGGLEDAAPPGALTAGLARAEELSRRWAEADTEAMLAGMIHDEFPGRIALVSSFGAEAAVLLHMVAGIEPRLPVIFLDTGKLFGETLRYRDRLTAELGLRDVRSIRPDPARLDALDPDGVLWFGNPDMCCHIRKVEPLDRALAGFDAWITGRKGFHGGERDGLQRIERNEGDGRIKVNPLALWRRADIDAYFERCRLPRHPLEADGFLSIGCMPCTDRVAPGENPRAGRWRGTDKTECGIHLSPARKWNMNGMDGI